MAIFQHRKFLFFAGIVAFVINALTLTHYAVFGHSVLTGFTAGLGLGVAIGSQKWNRR